MSTHYMIDPIPQGFAALFLIAPCPPPIAKASRGVPDDARDLFHRFPALHFGRVVADDHTFDIHHRGVRVALDESHLEWGHESLLWRMGRLCDQASGPYPCLPTHWMLTVSLSALSPIVGHGLCSCYGPQLGYTIPTTFLRDAGLSTELANVAETSLLLLLSLHLVAAGLSTVIFILSLFLHSHAVAIIALIIAIVGAIVGTVVFAVDVALVIGVKDNINALFSGASFNVQFGNAVWMILAAMILTWVAVVVLSARACYCCGVRRPKGSPPEISDKSSS
ncbi:hypothetical protein JVT61DRAFT_651 [Boletus reticuloceps]|uniref:Pali-domain-containing protein n=1 Tax=Boletus reticuloceps TaxID=495285 RepID=A0A8I2Z1G9_9AGAM|nr:hypothetical protein JVT61DRAFT_651 [Boletus reticuloceps]